MILIPAKKGRSTSPMVTVRAPSKHQRCIAMNASLAKQVDLDKIGHVAIDLDEKTRTITFIPVDGPTYQGHPAHRLINDGGGNTVGKAVYLQVDQIPESLVASKRYEATLKARGRFSIKFS